MAKILFLATEDWFFASHFLPLVKAARDCALDVIVASRVDRHRNILEDSGCRVIALPIRRGKLGPVALIGEIAAVLQTIRNERPDIVHCIALRMVILGGIASRLAGVRRVILAITGLGTLWLNQDGLSIGARAVVRAIVRGLARRGAVAVFENHDDPHEFGLEPGADNVAIVPGAGVSATAFRPAPEPPSPPVKFAIVSRMLRTKGIAEAVAAASQLRAETIELHLFGSPDPTNRDSCTENELRAFAAEPNIFWHGPTDDVARVWQEHHVAVLLSYREGLPRALVEAAAAGRPIIATDVPGCREVIRDGVEGLLVPPKDADAAVSAMRRLAASTTLRQQMGDAARDRFEREFTERGVREKVGALYRRLVGEGAPVPTDKDVSK
jgi:glycosyltransferase involved in cell wall biosynthesis